MASLTRIALFLPLVRQGRRSPIVRDERPELPLRHTVRKDARAVPALDFPVGHTRIWLLPGFDRVKQTSQRKQFRPLYRRSVCVAQQAAGCGLECGITRGTRRRCVERAASSLSRQGGGLAATGGCARGLRSRSAQSLPRRWPT